MTFYFNFCEKISPTKLDLAMCQVDLWNVNQEAFWAEESNYSRALGAVSLRRSQESGEPHELDFSQLNVEDKYENIGRDWC